MSHDDRSAMVRPSPPSPQARRDLILVRQQAYAIPSLHHQGGEQAPGERTPTSIMGVSMRGMEVDPATARHADLRPLEQVDSTRCVHLQGGQDHVGDLIRRDSGRPQRGDQILLWPPHQAPALARWTCELEVGEFLVELIEPQRRRRVHQGGNVASANQHRLELQRIPLVPSVHPEELGSSDSLTCQRRGT